MTTKYDKTAQKEVANELHQFKAGKAKTSAGTKVKSKKQAVAIGLSKAKKKGGKVPAKK